MRTEKIIEEITEYLQKNVCDKLHFLKYDDMRQDITYTPEYVTPTAHALFVPTKEKFNPQELIGKILLPGVAIQYISGTDDLISSESEHMIRLIFCVWNPGKYTDENGNATFERNYDGWKDVYRFMEEAKIAIQTDLNIEGIQLVKSAPMTYGAIVDESNSIPDGYPWWFCHLTFSVKVGVQVRNNKKFERFL